MSKEHDSPLSAFIPYATVLYASRRYVDIAFGANQTVRGKLGARDLEPCVGDKVSHRMDGGECIIESILPRKNCLLRSYEGKEKRLVANADHVLAVTAVGALFNTQSIDRILLVAKAESIPCALIVNKTDKQEDLEASRPLIAVYEQLGLEVILTSAKEDSGIERVTQLLSTPSIQIVPMIGVSGVGKSTLLNYFVPNAQAITREVSDRTGQGRQTTSQARAFQCRIGTKEFFLVDLPGIQSFGINHLTEEQVRLFTPEFVQYMGECRFSNCAHLKEEECGVMRAVEQGKIPFSRYESYVGIVAEIRRAKRY
jgi:ribosome biogenesis GTPase